MFMMRAAPSYQLLYSFDYFKCDDAMVFVLAFYFITRFIQCCWPQLMVTVEVK